ncbi:MAG: sigma-54 dependent transcriptional regulator [Spirochaetes bacterium]|nr:sigma-54 dependent transcriptional regulator [Spirochaetota bacterium]MBU0955387.1 sigma-54 dependent transcriptional regulator [Spirochaetota bacterium]
MKKILIINPDQQERMLLQALLSQYYDTFACKTCAEALIQLETTKIVCVILDISPASFKDLEAINQARHEFAQELLVFCSGADSPLEFVVDCIKGGADYYIGKPFRPEIIKKVLANLHTIRKQAIWNQNICRPGCENTQLSLAKQREDSQLKGESSQMQQLRSTILRFARFDTSVLIVGETGTGKELAARELHKLSGRRKGPFLAVDCASMPENLAESMIFGSERGAYTDSVQREGVFEKAKAGTVFLDELAELPMTVQAKLLRTLELRQGSRLGSHQLLDYNIRIVSATNARHLNNKCRFRPELLSRLDTLVIEMPPLRNHPEDIPMLCTHFMKNFGRVFHLTKSALDKLMSWHWPCNIRELKNVIERASVLTDHTDTIRPEDIQTDLLSRWTDTQPRLF